MQRASSSTSIDRGRGTARRVRGRISVAVIAVLGVAAIATTAAAADPAPSSSAAPPPVTTEPDPAPPTPVPPTEPDPAPPTPALPAEPDPSPQATASPAEPDPVLSPGWTVDADGNASLGSPSDARVASAEEQFVVAVDDAAALSAVVDELAADGVAVTTTWSSGLHGLVAPIDDATVAELQARPDVIAVEPNQQMQLSGTQSGAPWNLDRIDQAQLPLDGSYTYITTGAGVTAYVIDSGLRLSHSDFAGRVPRYAYINRFGTIADCNGHGTHVAGTLGGTHWGVAKQVTIIPIRVAECNGSLMMSDVVLAANWAIADHVSGPAVANLSLGGGASAVTDDAMNRMVADGITVVVAAGNEASNSCNFSPARTPAAITVAASERDDDDADYSNYGSCNDIFAPGSDITSASALSDTGSAVLSGTSMASPAVAGAAALLLQASPSATPAQVWQALDARATRGVITLCCGDPDRLLRVEPYVAPPPPPPANADGPGAASRAPGQIDVFARGDDDALWTRTLNGSSWSAWTTLGGIIVSAPAAAARQPGVLDTFVRGQDDALWARAFNGSSWGGWYSLGGILTSAPAVASRSATTLDLFVAGSDRALWTRSFNGTSWGPWHSLGGIITATPAVASPSPGTLAVFARGQDNALWTQTFDGASWSGWYTLGGIIETAPGAVSRSAGSYEVFARGIDGALWTRRYTGGVWSAWWSLGGLVTSPTAAVSASPGVVDVFTRGSDAALWSNRDSGAGFGGWYSLGGIIR